MGTAMRLTDDEIQGIFWTYMNRSESNAIESLISTVRRCLALAALPDEQKPYEDVERRGFSVSQPGELPR